MYQGQGMRYTAESPEGGLLNYSIRAARVSQSVILVQKRVNFSDTSLRITSGANFQQEKRGARGKRGRCGTLVQQGS